MASVRREAGGLRGRGWPRARGGAAFVGVRAPGSDRARGRQDLALPAARRRREAVAVLPRRRDQVRALVSARPAGRAHCRRRAYCTVSVKLAFATVVVIRAT